MPVIGRRPAIVLRETGVVSLVVSEESQRSRGKMLLKDASGSLEYVCYETPLMGERLAWVTSLQENSVQLEPTFTPVLVREVNSEKGVSPNVVRYLRHALNPEIYYFPDTQEVHLFWWANTWTPLTRFPTLENCIPIELEPSIIASKVGTWIAYPDINGDILVALKKDPQTASTDKAVWSGSDWIFGCLVRTGTISLRMNPRGVSLSGNMRWLGAIVRISVSRMSVPGYLLTEFGLPEDPSVPSYVPPGGVYSPVALNGPFIESNPEARVWIKGDINVSNGGLSSQNTIRWVGQDNALELDIEPGVSSSVQVYTGTLRLNEPVLRSSEVFLNLEVQTNPLTWPIGKYLAAYITGIEVELTCASPEQFQINQLYSSTRKVPPPWTVSLPVGEPHSNVRTIADEKFNHIVGDPPEDPGGGWPGLYNRHDLTNLVQSGGTAMGKNWNPFTESDAFKNLPPTPGMVRYQIVKVKGDLISLSAIDGHLIEHTNHIFHVRELQDLRISSRTLMYARGRFQDLSVIEDSVEVGLSSVIYGDLTIGISDLAPGIKGEVYKGPGFIIINDPAIIFPFGVGWSDINQGVLITVGMGEQGHQYHASGGMEPYQWTLRPIKSASLPRFPMLVAVGDYPVSPTQLMPFDDDGNLIPGRDFPDGVEAGGMPLGMLFNKDGVLYGKPLETGTFLFRIHVKDAQGKHGEASIRLVVLNRIEDEVPCSRPRVTPEVFKTTITQIICPPILGDVDADNWVGSVTAIGGTIPYSYSFPNPSDYPKQQVPQNTSGTSIIQIQAETGVMRAPTLSSSNWTGFTGVWLWEVQAVETVSSGIPTCDRQPVTFVVGVAPVAGSSIGVTPNEGVLLKFDGDYQREQLSRTFLVLDAPIPVKSFAQGKSVSIRGSNGHVVRYDLGGPFLNPGPITAFMPGVINSAGAFGVYEEIVAPSHYQLDWVNSNPMDCFRSMSDRFELPSEDVTTSDDTTDLPPVEGSSIDWQIPYGKRIRPLWPV